MAYVCYHHEKEHIRTYCLLHLLDIRPTKETCSFFVCVLVCLNILHSFYRIIIVFLSVIIVTAVVTNI